MSWKVLADERWMTYSPIGLRLVDDFTGKDPAYKVSATLEIQGANLDWQQTNIKETITTTGIISYPGLGRSAYFATAPVQRYRFILQSDYYRAEYLMNMDAIEFDAHPYDDNNPPAVINNFPLTVMLLPGPAYPFEGHLRVVRGTVQDINGNPVANVEVSEGFRERVLTDARGAFSLPLRWPVLSGPVVIDAVDHRTGRTDSLNINLPGDLTSGHVFTIT